MKINTTILLLTTVGLIVAMVYITNREDNSQMTEEHSNLTLPEYVCKKVHREIKLTGKLEDPLWQEAEAIQLNDAITGKPGRFSTEVRVLYDDKFLYVGFHCEDDYAWGTVTERDGPIWNEESVEVFVNPAGTAHQYYEINVSPKNVIFDSCILNRRTEENPNNTFIGLPEWNVVDLQTATNIDGEADQHGKAKSWSAEFAIPHSELIGAPNVPPKHGDIWRINVYRIDSPRKDQREHYAWIQTGRPAFHLPWRFAYLRFE